jgi:hypothetical protein
LTLYLVFPMIHISMLFGKKKCKQHRQTQFRILESALDPNSKEKTKQEKLCIQTSVADPDHFDADPDPTSEKTGWGSGS